MEAVARFDYGLSLEEFGRLTLPQFWRLWERRAAEFKRFCYLQGIPAAATYNAARTDQKQHIFSPHDFVPRSPEEAQREEIVMMLRAQWVELKPTQLEPARQAWRKKITEIGRDDVEDILAEIFDE